jgi:predicted MFS family arabinose efflux permease
MTWQERKILFLLGAVQFTHILDFMIMMPLGSFLMPHFSISPGYFSVIVAAYPVTAFFAGLIAAFHVDRFDRKKVLMAAYAGFLIGTLSCGLAPNAALLMASRVATGLFGGLIGAQVMAIVADLFPYEKRGRAMGAVYMAFAVASIIGVPFSLYLARHFNWHAPFLFIGALGWLLMPLIHSQMPSVDHHVSTEAERPGIRETIGGILTNRNQVNALMLTGMLVFGHFLLIPFINPYMEFNKGFTKSQTPLIYMTGGVCSMLASWSVGRISDGLGKFRVFVAAVLFSLIPILLITDLPDWPLAAVLALFGFWFAASTSRLIPVQAMVSTVVDNAGRGRFMSFQTSFQQLSAGLASLVSGALVSKSPEGRILHYDRVGWLSATVVFLTILLGYRLAKRQGLR